MPQGFPGVASSINRPNSGWNVGSGSPSLAFFSNPAMIPSYCIPRHPLQVRDTPPLFLQSFVHGKSIQDVGLAKGELNFLFLVVVGNYKIFDLVIHEPSGVRTV